MPLSDRFRSRPLSVAAGVVLVCAALAAGAVAGAANRASPAEGADHAGRKEGPDASAPSPADSERTGGDTTVYATGRNAFSFPAANLPDPERTRFVIGNSFFKRNWVEAPASTSARDGLGPRFIARSCGGCHLQDGRAEPPEFRNGLQMEQPVGLLMRLSIAGIGPHGGPNPDPVYGDQFQNAAIQGVKPDGEITVRYTPVRGRFADGTRYTLQKPQYGFRQLAHGPLAPGILVSPRIAPQVIGIGLLEAIPDSEIQGNAERQAAAGGPIQGTANLVWDAPSNGMRIGRFGWKANTATVAHQTGAAFVGDIGITSSLFPDEHCSQTQTDCLKAPRGNGGQGPEIDDEAFANVVFYQATLAPPARRGMGDPQVQRGEKLFAEAQCATCHRPSYVTAEGPFPEFTSKALAGQRIWPYTDLLLHDMGEGLADGRPDFAANGRQWRTPPLWGIGLIKDVNNHTRLLHDGRADGVLEAILWHGGEAEGSRQHVLKMSKAEREALVRFVESL